MARYTKRVVKALGDLHALLKAGWTQGLFSKCDIFMEGGVLLKEAPCRYCLVGGLRKVTLGRAYEVAELTPNSAADFRLNQQTGKALVAALPKSAQPSKYQNAESVLIDYNDKAGTTKLAVLRLVKRAQRLATGAAVALVLALSVYTQNRAEAGEIGDWLDGLKQPGTLSLCCSEADCHRTPADFDGEVWWGRPRGVFEADPLGAPVPVPPAVVLQKEHSPDGEAWMCDRLSGFYDPQTGYGHEILCFVKPEPRTARLW